MKEREDDPSNPEKDKEYTSIKQDEECCMLRKKTQQEEEHHRHNTEVQLKGKLLPETGHSVTVETLLLGTAC